MAWLLDVHEAASYLGLPSGKPTIWPRVVCSRAFASAPVACASIRPRWIASSSTVGRACHSAQRWDRERSCGLRVARTGGGHDAIPTR